MITRRRRKIKRRVGIRRQANIHFTRGARYIILSALSARLPMNRAAELAGVTGKVLALWMEKGLSDDPMLECRALYASFRRRVLKIRAQHERDALKRIEAAARGGRKVREVKVRVKSLGPVVEKEVTKVVKYESPRWQADAWWLERVKRGTYGVNATSDEQALSAEEAAASIKEAADVLFDSVPIEGGGVE